MAITCGAYRTCGVCYHAVVMAIIVPTNPIHFITGGLCLFFLPFWYLGHCFSYLNGYYRHYGSESRQTIAWGVSKLRKIYNWLFFSTVTTPSTISVRKCIGRRWKSFAKAFPICRNRKAPHPSSARTCWDSDPDCRNAGSTMQGRTGEAIVGQAHRLPSKLQWQAEPLALQIFSESARSFSFRFALFL